MAYQKVMCLKEIEPCDQYLLTILLDSTINLIIGKLRCHLMRTCIFTLVIKKDIHMSCKDYEEKKRLGAQF